MSMRDDSQASYTDDSSRLDPNSPERQRAARYAMAAKVCMVLGFIGLGLVFLGAVLLKIHDGSLSVLPLVLPLIAVVLLGNYFQGKERKLRCTKRTTAHCIDTVRRHSGKHVRRHPIVEYEADGVILTTELSVTCTRSAVGELYTIYYDPLDPSTVRVERTGLFG